MTASNVLFLGRMSEGVSLPLHLASDHQYAIFPGFCDVHVHFREPGFSYKETMATGSAAALHGGYTAVCAMPNVDPVPDTREHLESQLALTRGAGIRVCPYGAISVGRKGTALSEMEEMAPDVIAFSDDGSGVQDPALMRTAMQKAAKLHKIIAAHCEQNDLLRGGYIHNGSYARAHGHRGISSESEWRQIERDIALARETGCAYHVCHISCKESVALIRKAKKEGVDISCETAPHYLILDENALEEDGRFKMNPPLRSREDREALIEGILDGTVDMIATDHAPHSREEKSKGLQGSAMGIVGLETAFPALYTALVLPGIIPLEKIVSLLTVAPRGRFSIPDDPNEYTLWDLTAKQIVTEAFFRGKGTSSPWLGRELQGVCLKTQSSNAVFEKE